MRILIIDDSATFRTQIRAALETIPGVEIVGSASNGKIAMQMIEQKNVQMITLDLNMPVMDGLTTLENLQKRGDKLHTIVFASKSARSAKDTLTALRLGATDFVVKPDGTTGSISDAKSQVEVQLVPIVKVFLSKFKEQSTPVRKSPAKNPIIESISSYQTTKIEHSKSWKRHRIEQFDPMAIVIASSTGGPMALEKFLSQLNGPPRIPIFLVQHMPATFTKFFAKRLTDITGVLCKEAENGEKVEAGKIYIAPGDYHMAIKDNDGKFYMTVTQGPRINQVRPAADPLFESASKLYGNQLLGFVLTGMGEDGAVGCDIIKNAGGAVAIQDEETCVVWGMPKAVHDRGSYDSVRSLDDLSGIIARAVNQKIKKVN
jgi:two-component system, chemotaxis family, protein-glutamate methylesterase/glutaminase